MFVPHVASPGGILPGDVLHLGTKIRPNCTSLMHSSLLAKAKTTRESVRRVRSLRQVALDEGFERTVRIIYCVSCGTPLALASDAIIVAGQHEHSFINPEGYLYRIRCFAEVRNVLTLGEPSSKFSWFPGHTWVILQCVACCVHVGWQFDGGAARFYALIADKIADDVESEAQ